MRELDLARSHQQVLIRRRRVRDAGKQDFAMLRLLHFHLRGTSQQAGNPALVLRRKVCTTTMLLGKVLGSVRRTCLRALSPPTDDPIATTS
jgi:hypothetical protein